MNHTHTDRQLTFGCPACIADQHQAQRADEWATADTYTATIRWQLDDPHRRPLEYINPTLDHPALTRWPARWTETDVVVWHNDNGSYGHEIAMELVERYGAEAEAAIWWPWFIASIVKRDRIPPTRPQPYPTLFEEITP
jgi:hypothetical protein